MLLRVKTLASLALLGLLTACSGEPGAGEMERAVAQLINQTIAQTRQLLQTAGSHRVTINAEDFKGFDSFKKIGCEKLEGNRGYQCSFSYEATVNGRHEASTRAGRFYQSEYGWMVEITK